MSKTFWKDLAEKGPICALAPMDGYGDSPYRQLVKSVAPHVVVFSEFYSADGLVHSKDLQRKALTHSTAEYPLIIQIFGKDPAMFAEAARIIEGYGITGIDINMGCPAKKVVKSGHGSSLMINRDTAFRIVEEMSKAVNIPVSVKTRLGWEDHSLLVEFAKGLENAGANLVSVHGRTYKQAFTGKADLTGIYELKQHMGIPIMCNGDVKGYDDGVMKIVHPMNSPRTKGVGGISPNNEIHISNPTPESTYKNLDGFMIGRASFGNPWCFRPGTYTPTLREILETMTLHGQLLWQCKEKKGMLEARKHLVQYLHSFPNVKEYRGKLVQVEDIHDIQNVIQSIYTDHVDLLDTRLQVDTAGAMAEAWGAECG